MSTIRRFSDKSEIPKQRRRIVGFWLSGVYTFPLCFCEEYLVGVFVYYNKTAESDIYGM